MGLWPVSGQGTERYPDLEAGLLIPSLRLIIILEVSVAMVLGDSIIAVPRDIATAEIVETAVAERTSGRPLCPHSGSDGHEAGALLCRDFGATLDAADADGWRSRCPGAHW